MLGFVDWVNLPVCRPKKEGAYQVFVFSSAIDRPVESHSGAHGNISAGPCWGENFLNFSF